MITSQYNISPKKTTPRFVVKLQNDMMVCARDYFAAHFQLDFAQIDPKTVEIHKENLEFDIPKQNDQVFDILSSHNIALNITLFRSSDSTYAQNPQPFQYFMHSEGFCPFCAMKNTLQNIFTEVKLEMPQIDFSAGKQNQKRNFDYVKLFFLSRGFRRSLTIFR